MLNKQCFSMVALSIPTSCSHVKLEKYCPLLVIIKRQKNSTEDQVVAHLNSNESLTTLGIKYFLKSKIVVAAII